MLNQAKTLHGYKLNSSEGEIGKVKEFYFDDYFWTIRYLVADTGNWLADRQVLLSPHSLGIVNKDAQNIAVKLSKKQIEDSPPLKTDIPVSRQYEESFHKYFAVPAYWNGPLMWGPYYYPSGMPRVAKLPKLSKTGEKFDSHLRSTHGVSGYHIQAKDGEIGHVEDFIIDDETWAIRYLIVDTRNLWEGKIVLISPRWIDHISWDESKVFVNLSRDAIKQSPEYIEGSPLSREYETALHQHYNFQGYWVEEPAAQKNSA